MESDGMTPDLICGIDPGVTGGISILDRSGAVVGSWKMPETEVDIAELLSEYAPRLSFAVIERVQPMPTGTIAMFKLGRSYGFLRGLLAILQIPRDEVRAQEWQKAMGCMSRGKKAVTRQKAQQLWPKVKITNATADSLLLAEFARRNR
jgi:hypothetical protein